MHFARTGDTFLAMSTWGKGIVFVNGHNIDRYWSIGTANFISSWLLVEKWNERNNHF